MNSRITEDFVECFRRLPEATRELARKNYRLWVASPSHPSLRFKRVHKTEPVYSARVGIGCRVLGLMDGDAVTWFWIGSHDEYERMIAQL
ncbi:MAG: hypothetical protein ACREJC_07400 [Tepidisphaeraceae bacterium]